MRARISSTRQAVIRGPSFTGFGYRPDFTPAHHVDLLTGIGPRGARMEERRTKPVSESAVRCDMSCPRSSVNEGVLLNPSTLVAEFG